MSRRQTATLFLIVVLLATILSAETIGAEVLCGDVNGDGHGPNIGDLTFLVAFIFHSGETTGYFLPADVNGQFGINISDVTYFVSFLFQGGPPPICPATGVLADGNGCINMGFKSEVAGEPYATSSDCLEEVSDESMWVELIGNDLHVHHMNAYYNCCLMYDVTFDIEGRNITACEADTGDQCFCLCYFDLEAVLPGLEITEPCEYVVTLIGIEGDTVGVDTLAIGGEEYMYVDVINDDLYIHHMNAYANCCPEFFYRMGFPLRLRLHLPLQSPVDHDRPAAGRICRDPDWCLCLPGPDRLSDCRCRHGCGRNRSGIGRAIRFSGAFGLSGDYMVALPVLTVPGERCGNLSPVLLF